VLERSGNGGYVTQLASDGQALVGMYSCGGNVALQRGQVHRGT